MLQAMNTGHDGSLSTVHANAPARRARPHRDDGADGRLRPAGAGDPPAGLVGARPDRPPRAHGGRLAPGHGDHRGAADGVGRDHAPGHLRVQDRLVRARRHDQRASSSRTGLRPIFLDKFAKRGIELPAGPVLASGPFPRTSRISAGEPRSPLRRRRRSPRSLVALVAFPAAAGRRRGLQVVEAGTRAVPRPRVRPDAARDAKPPLTTDDVKVTENGKPVQEPGRADRRRPPSGIGTVLLIDASNSMKDSIDEAMAGGARVRRAEPRAAALGRLLQREADGRAAAHDRPQGDRRGAREAAEARRGDARSTTRSARPSPRCAGRRSARRASSSSRTATTSAASRRLDSAIAQLQAQKIRVFTVGIESPRLHRRRPREDRRRDRRDVRRRDLARGARRRSTTQLGFELGERVPAPLPLRRRGPTRTSKVAVAVAGRRARSRSRTRAPSSATSGPYKPAFRDTLLQSWLLIPLVVAAILGLLVARPPVVLEPPREQGSSSARLGEFVTLPEEQRAAERRKEVDALLAAVGQQKQRQRNWRWIEGFSEDVDVAQIDSDPTKMIWIAVVAGLLLGVRRRGVLLGPLLVRPRDRARRSSSTSSSAGRRARSGTSSPSSSPRTSTCSPPRSARGHSLAGAMGVVVETRRPSPPSASSAASSPTSSSASRSTRRSR